MKISPKIINILKKSYLIVGIAIFIWIIRGIDFAKLKDSFYAISPFYSFAAAVLYFPVTFLKSYRWKKIMDGQKIHYSIKNSFLMYGSSSLLSIITPARVGDFSKMAYLKKDGYSLSRAFLGNFLDKFFDLAFVTVFLSVSIMFLPYLPSMTWNFGIMKKWGWAVLILAVAIFFYFRKKEPLFASLAEIWQDIKQFKFINLAYIFAITAVAWFFYFLMIYLIATSVNITPSVGFFYLSLGAAFALIAGLLPITFLGLGARDAVFIFLLLPLGIPRETIVLFSLLVLLNYLSLFAICFYCWLKKPII